MDFSLIKAILLLLNLDRISFLANHFDCYVNNLGLLGKPKRLLNLIN